MEKLRKRRNVLSTQQQFRLADWLRNEHANNEDEYNKLTLLALAGKAATALEFESLVRSQLVKVLDAAGIPRPISPIKPNNKNQRNRDRLRILHRGLLELYAMLDVQASDELVYLFKKRPEHDPQHESTQENGSLNGKA